MQINAQKFQVDQELRAITFSCCTEEPCKRYDQEHQIEYEQVLIINENTVDLSRLKNGASVLFNHDSDKLLGMVEDAYIADSRVFVRVRFSSNDAFADRIYKDILEGIIKNVSIGYQIEHYEDKVEDGINRRYVDKFMIFETSIVSIPADASCGIRKLQIKDINMEDKKECDKVEEKQMDIEKEEIDKEKVEQKVEDKVEQVKACGEDEEMKRLKEENQQLKCKLKELEDGKVEQEEKPLDDQTRQQIKKIGQDFKVDKEEIERAINDKLSVRDFKQKIKTLNFSTKNKETKNMNAKTEFRDFIKAGDFDKSFMLRDFTGFGGQEGQNGAPLIGTTTFPLVAALQKVMGLRNFRTLSNLHFNVSIPVQTGRPTPQVLSDVRAAAAESNPSFTAKVLTPVKISANTIIGKDLLLQAEDSVTQFVIDSLVKEIGYKVENFMLNKIIEAQPTEINYSSLSAIDWSDIVAFEAATGGFALTNLEFIMSPSARSVLKSTPKTANYPSFLCEDNTINGYPCRVSGCVDNDTIFYGDFGHLILGIFGPGMQLIINPYSYAAAGQLQVVASLAIDACVDQTDAFAIGRVQAQSETSESSDSSL